MWGTDTPSGGVLLAARRWQGLGTVLAISGSEKNEGGT